MNNSQSSQAVPGNRITFTSQSLQNGTINISSGHPGTTGGPTIISTAQLPNTTTIKTITSNMAGGAHGLPQQVQVQHHQVLQTQQSGQANQQQQQQSVGATQTQTLVIKSNHAAGIVSSAPGIVTMTKSINQGNQPILNSMIPANVVVGMRPQGAPQQKNMQSNTLGRVVIGGPHMVNTRPQASQITLSALNPGQTSALLLKTENGYQFLRVGTAATSSPVTQTIGTNSTNPTQIRLQTVPAASLPATSVTSNNIVNSIANSTAHTYNTPTTYTLQQQPLTSTNLTTLGNIQQQPTHLTTQLHTQPQITQIQTIQSAAQQQQQLRPLPQVNLANNISTTATSNLTTTTTTQNTVAQGNTKEKCRKFLANLIDLSTREEKPVEKNVRNLIQELVNANVEPEEFCDRLERLLNASPQPCLIGFLKKSLPLLRQALYSKELIIEGIKPPPHNVVGMASIQHQLPNIQAQIRPIGPSQTTTIGQTQVRMISPATIGPRPIGTHATITKQPTNIRIQAPTTAPRLINAQIRGPIPATIQPQPPQLQTSASIVQIRAPTAATITRPATVQIRATKAKGANTGITHVKVGQTQIKAIPAITQSQPPLLTAISSNTGSINAAIAATQSSTISSSTSILSTINSVASNSLGPPPLNNTISLPIPSLPTVQLPPSLMNASATISSALLATPEQKLLDIKLENNNKLNATTTITPTLVRTTFKTNSTPANKATSKKKKDDKDRDDKTTNASTLSTAASSFFQQPSISMSSALYGDDDINDVAAMGGVNLAEESQRILGCTENIGTQIRSCKDEVFLHLPALQQRLRTAMLEKGLDEPTQDAAVLISHACQEHMKNIVEKLAVIADHRIDVIKMDSRYEVTRDIRSQIKFLEELDKAEQKRHEELEREMLLRAAKSRSKLEDPEQLKMKARAKEMQRAEMEELRQRDANLTALQAIGPRKKIKLESEAASASGTGSNNNSLHGTSGGSTSTLRPRIKRINLRDMIFYLEQERDTGRSEMLYKLYLK